MLRSPLQPLLLLLLPPLQTPLQLPLLLLTLLKPPLMLLLLLAQMPHLRRSQRQKQRGWRR